MAFAPYTACLKKLVRGGFRNSNGHWFEYAAPEAGEFLPFPGYETKVFVGPFEGEFRWAKVKASRAYVVIDENEHGLPTVEKWVIKTHKVYPTSH